MDLLPALVTAVATAPARVEHRRGRWARPGKWVLRLLVALLSLSPAPHLHAQSGAPFSTLDVGVAGAAHVNRDGLHELWHPGHGAVVRVSTPFYVGSAAVSAQLASFRSRGTAQPDFRALTTAAEWNLTLNDSRRLSGFAGLQIGVMGMTFLRPDDQAENLDENELLVGGQAGVRARLAGRVRLSLTASHRRLLTHVPIDLTYASVGIEYRQPTPLWLSEFLQ